MLFIRIAAKKLCFYSPNGYLKVASVLPCLSDPSFDEFRDPIPARVRVSRVPLSNEPIRDGLRKMDRSVEPYVIDHRLGMIGSCWN